MPPPVRLSPRIGAADGAPYSVERRQQLEHLWARNIPDLHLTTPHDDTLKGAKMSAYLGLDQGRYLFLRAVYQPGDTDYLSRLLKRFRTDTKKDENFLKDNGEIQSALCACHRYVRDKIALQEYLSAHPKKTSQMRGWRFGVNVYELIHCRQYSGKVVTLRKRN